MATVAPDLNIPASADTVDVSIIDTTTVIKGVRLATFMEPSISGHDYLGVPAYSFLIQHPSGRTMIFDLGVRKDWKNLSPAVGPRLEASNYHITVDKSVREILEQGGIDCTKIEAVVWSHWHFDHTGNPAEFDPSTALIVGPGFKEHMLPGYPARKDSTFWEAEYAGREMIELSFTSGLRIGKMEALDYFGDGSFYFLNSPGHATGHICGLARVTAEPPSFILMGGDAYHHAGELRPSAHLPLPDHITPHPFAPLTLSSCPGELFTPVLRDGSKSKSIYLPSTTSGIHADPAEAARSIEKLQEADVRGDVLMVSAHDASLLDILDFYPDKANEFVQKGWVEKARWRFLVDFAKAIGYDGEIEGKQNWEAPIKV